MRIHSARKWKRHNIRSAILGFSSRLGGSQVVLLASPTGLTLFVHAHHVGSRHGLNAVKASIAQPLLLSSIDASGRIGRSWRTGKALRRMGSDIGVEGRVVEVRDSFKGFLSGTKRQLQLQACLIHV